MKKKKIIIIIVSLVIATLLSGGIYYILTRQDKNTTLTILEKQWIEENKNEIIDLGMINKIPIFNYNGEGLLFDFVDSLETVTGLEFNKLSYNISGKIPATYAFVYTNEQNDNDILIYQDNYAILSGSQTKYNRLQDIPQMTVGVLEDDLESVSFYLRANPNISYKTYSNAEKLLDEIEKDDATISGVVLPKTVYMEELANKHLNIIYQITEMHQNLVLRLGDNKRLNTIIKKYYKKWSQENYQQTYNTYFSKSYFKFNEIYEENVAQFKSKRYQFGFISYAPYNALVNNHLTGINNEIMKQFSHLADIEISFKQYSSMDKLLEDFNANKIDFFMNTTNQNEYALDIYKTVSAYDEQIVILSHIDTNETIHSLASLRGKKVMTLKNSYISDMLSSNEATIETFDNVQELINNLDKESIVVVDQDTYYTYVNDAFKKYRVDYIFPLNQSYNFIIRDINDNNVFARYFDFYLSFIDEATFKNEINYSMFVDKIENYTKIIMTAIVIIIILIVGFITLGKKRHVKYQNKVTSISKENKLRYIDMLTSLKNRNYLNDNIQKWDESEIYPQTIIIVDLNNVAYINDNYGHEEGDNVIREAANILIHNQLENSEIIRTNGNEFLIYMVEYEEKQVVAYIRKLSKEFKEIAHGFGAAIGYSMIQDAIKTVDDAINEATLDMRNNKEEANN